MSKGDLQSVSIALKDNAYDFIEKGLESIISNNEKEYKFAILHLYSGVLLFLKDILYKEHWTLVFQDVNQADKMKLKKGDIVSVDFNTLIKRLETTESFDITPKLLSDLDWLRKQRNKIEHLHNEINPHEVKSRIASTLNHILVSFHHHKRLLGIEEDDYLANPDYEYIEFIELFQNYSFRFDEFIRKRLQIIKTELETSFLLIKCPSCMENTMELNPDRSGVKCHFCLSEMVIDSFLTLYVSDFFEVMLEGYTINNCPHCEGNLIFEYDGKEICFECISTFEIGSLRDCSKCGTTFETIEDEHLEVCDSCIEYMWKRD